MHCFCVQISRGLYFSLKTIFFPPPSENDIFSPSHDTWFFDSHRGLFVLILPYFAFILPFYFPFSHFLSPFFLFLSPFFLFSFTFSPFSLPLYIFSPKWHQLIFSRGGGVFSNIRQTALKWFLSFLCYLFCLGITIDPLRATVGAKRY